MGLIDQISKFANPIGSLVGGVTSIIAGNKQAKENRKAIENTNQMNLQIARETNQANKDLYSQQFQDQLALQDKMNAYNSAPQQVERLRAAGLNPATAFGSGSTAAASASVPSAAPAQSATMQPALTQYFDTWVTQALNGISSLTDAFKSQSETKGIQIDNQTRAEQNRVALDQAQEDVRKTIQEVKNMRQDHVVKEKQLSVLEQSRRQLQFANDLNDASYDDLVQQSRLSNLLTQAQTNQAKAQADLASDQLVTQQLARSLSIQQNTREWDALKNTISVGNAQIQNLISQANLNHWSQSKVFAEVNDIIQRTAASAWNNKILRQQFEHDNESFPVFMNQMKIQFNQQLQDFNNPFKYVGNLLGGSGSAIISRMPK